MGVRVRGGEGRGGRRVRAALFMSRQVPFSFQVTYHFVHPGFVLIISGSNGGIKDNTAVSPAALNQAFTPPHLLL